ncbi:uncharacterized protein LOC141641697 [Silene latifolia]|uniref:uncharacterized protein LOC141641697 n=1 Tax=Silene latifolia TaxID=37657 RepID=UPI003D776AB1
MQEAGTPVKGGPGMDHGMTVERWERPREGWCKVNVDAGILCGQGSGMGVVCRDAGGCVKWSVALQQLTEREPKILEAEAVLLGLSEARRHGIARVVIESDCLNVIQDLKKRSTGRSDIFLIYDDIYELCLSFESVEFLFARRQFNRVAHELAHMWPWQLGRRIWYEDLAEFVSLDLVNTT